MLRIFSLHWKIKRDNLRTTARRTWFTRLIARLWIARLKCTECRPPSIALLRRAFFLSSTIDSDTESGSTILSPNSVGTRSAGTRIAKRNVFLPALDPCSLDLARQKPQNRTKKTLGWAISSPSSRVRPSLPLKENTDIVLNRIRAFC